MTLTEIVPLLTGTGGALAVLYLWNRDLIKQRDYERGRVSELTDRYAASTNSGNDAIRDLTNAVLDATDLVSRQAGAPPGRRRPSSAH